MSQGNLVKWHVKEGELISPGTVLADIETDKATLAFENQEDGYIAKLLVLENTKDIKVGTPVAVLVEEQSDIAAFANFSVASAAAAAAARSKAPLSAPLPPPTAPPPATHEAPAASTSTAGYPAHTKLAMPSLSPTMERGNIVKWMAAEGDEVKPGDILAEIETDKATLAFENQDEGFLARILMPAGSRDIAVGTTVAIIVEEREHVGAFASYSSDAAAAPAAAAAAAPAAAAAAGRAGVAANHRMGPAARMLLLESGLSASQIAPTGPNGIITKGDVLAAIQAGTKPAAAASSPKAAPPASSAAAAAAAPASSAAAAPPRAAAPVGRAPPTQSSPSSSSTPSSPIGSYTDTPNSQIRKIIASRLLESKVTIPALYLSMDTQLDEVARLRGMLLEQGIKVSVNDIVLKAIASALAEVPEANTYWDVAAQEVKPFAQVDVCVAVATERGLITPIIKGADKKSLQQISKEVRELAVRARDNKLTPQEFMGGSFTVSNLGMMGVNSFCAIINPPQAAILAVGSAQQRPALKNGKPAADTFMTVTLSADHRVYDGELASKLLTAFKGQVENPSRLLL